LICSFGFCSVRSVARIDGNIVCSKHFRACIRTNSIEETELCCRSIAESIKENGINKKFEIRFEKTNAEVKKALFKKLEGQRKE